MPRLEISLLGPMRVRRDERPCDGFESAKSRALLAYLAMEAGREHSRESIATLLWPEGSTSAARANLRNALANVRSAIGDRDRRPAHIQATRDTLRFDPHRECDLDARCFLDLVKAPGASADALARGLHLCRGAFLADVRLPDAPEFDAWVDGWRERLRGAASDAFRRLAEARAESGDIQGAIASARELLQLEPWDERGHRLLMRLLAQAGERSAALAQFEACRRVLRDELGIEPEPETGALREAISANQIPLLADQDVEPRHNLPAHVVPFVGRAKELARIQAHLLDPDCRLLSLVGPGGSGKTRLAQEAGRRLVDRFPDGVWFVPLAGVDSGEAIAPSIAQALGIQMGTSGSPRLESASPLPDALVAHLRRRRLLLILDNLEHLLDGVAIIAELLHSAAEVKVLSTSRARLRLAGEQVLAVRGMRYPAQAEEANTLRVMGTDPYSGITLFVEAARRARDGYDPDSADLGHIASICRIVDGMPLAILLAAAWMTTLAPGEILAHLKAPEALGFLGEGARDMPDRHRSMSAVMAHSWRLLDGALARVLMCLSVFRGGFTGEAARAVGGAGIADLAALVDRSLVQRDAAGRYDMHELLRQYAWEHAAEAKVLASARDAHADLLAGMMEHWELELHGPGERDATAAMEAEMGNILSAWDWAAESTRADWLDKMAHPLAAALSARRAEGEQAYARAAARLSQQSGPKGLLATLMAHQSAMGAWRDLDGNLELIRRAYALAETCTAQADVRHRAYVSMALAKAPDQIYDWTEDIHLARESVALYRDIGDRWGEAQALMRLGECIQASGRDAESKTHFLRAQELYGQLGSRSGLASVLERLGYVTRDLERAESLFRQVVTMAREDGRMQRILGSLSNLSRHLLFRLGKFRETEADIPERTRLAEELALPLMSAWCMVDRSGVALGLGRYDEAAEFARQLEEYGLELGWPVALAAGFYGHAYHVIGCVSLVQGQQADADRNLERGISHFRPVTMYHNSYLPNSISYWGLVALARGQLGQAQDRLRESLTRAQSLRWPDVAGVACACTACLLISQGELERGLAVHALATQQSLVANSCFIRDACRPHLEKAEAFLSREVVEAARQRGRAYDLWETVDELLSMI